MSTQWKFHQVFGDKDPSNEVTSADIISTLEFDQSGDFLAAGDNGGRLVIFEKTRVENIETADYEFFTEFQSHEQEFDYLKSVEIEEKINKVRWLPRMNASHLLLSTNDKTIKLWKVYEKNITSFSDLNTEYDNGEKKIRESFHSIHVPTMNQVETVCAALPKKVYANAHAYHINSLCLNSDNETFITADDLRVNLWNLGRSDHYTLLDIKPVNMEELSEVITTAELSPSLCNIFSYGTSKGAIKMCDMRTSSLCDTSFIDYDNPEDKANSSFFSEIISSVSDLKFNKTSEKLASRDYMTLKIWDTRMGTSPLNTFPIQEFLKGKFCDLYENDCIFDKFECSWSEDGRYVVTGSYGNMYYVCDTVTGTSQCFDAASGSINSLYLSPIPTSTIEPDNIDFTRKILHLACHPIDPLVSIAATNNLFFFYNENNTQGEEDMEILKEH